MSAGRGDRAAPPAPEGQWEVRFADAAAKGWESLGEVTGGGRVWYLLDTAADTCWITFASPGHPRATGR
ncbi:hypothetical protein ACFVQ0_15420 [Streptomyces sp. NPDC057900]|uniref:hypothetical protein n=1 Tax=Streptomyces sp. NPDC057900 TaxID=3346274 RepID=UPI0036E0E2EA